MAYRKTFQSSSSAQNYDQRVYAAGRNAEILWRVERQVLMTIVSELRGRFPVLHYLDFACGTGRVLAEIEGYADEATGIDISPYMLERARAKTQRAKLLCKDVTEEGDVVEGQYDLITCFRFLTNAEPELRAKALRSLARRMRNDQSRLLINTHSNPFSYRAMLLPYHWVKDRFAGRPLFGYLRTSQAIADLREAGFQVDQVIGMGFFPQKLHWLLPSAWIHAIEKTLVGVPYVQALGLEQLLICRLR